MRFLTSLIFWDLLLLILFTIGVFIFLYKKKKKVVRDGPLLLYKTQIGVKILDKLGKKYKRLWNVLSYFIVVLGYFLMITFTYLILKSVYLYVRYPQISKMVKAPPLMLLFPYFNRVFGATDLFPDLYFIYFIIVIAVIAIVHEGFHGIFMRHHGVKIKSTGFGFLGPILAFFVEQDEKDLESKKIFPQLSILAGGVFANIVVAILAFLLFWMVFSNCYVPYGVNTVGYATATIPGVMASNSTITNETMPVDGINATKILIDDKAYLVSQDFFDINFDEVDSVPVFQDQPAIRAGLKGIITKINGKQIESVVGLREELDKYEIGESIEVITDYNGEINTYQIELGESYEEKNKTVLGVGVGGNIFWMFNIIEPFKEYGVEYKPNKLPNLTNFVYYLLAWLVMLNALVAFFNMLPIAIFDGGRFFYLTMLAITKNKKFAERAFAFMTWLLLLGVMLIMLSWVVARFF